MKCMIARAAVRYPCPGTVNATGEVTCTCTASNPLSWVVSLTAECTCRGGRLHDEVLRRDRRGGVVMYHFNEDLEQLPLHRNSFASAAHYQQSWWHRCCNWKSMGRSM